MRDARLTVPRCRFVWLHAYSHDLAKPYERDSLRECVMTFVWHRLNLVSQKHACLIHRWIHSHFFLRKIVFNSFRSFCVYCYDFVYRLRQTIISFCYCYSTVFYWLDSQQATDIISEVASALLTTCCSIDGIIIYSVQRSVLRTRNHNSQAIQLTRIKQNMMKQKLN